VARSISTMNVILAVTGSVSAYKAPWLVRDLLRDGHTVRVLCTPSATQFVAPLALEAVSKHRVVVDQYDPSLQEGGSWHVGWAQWADVMLVAPCSATSLARLAYGLCDTAMMTVATSLPARKPIVVAPAMDTDMWLHPATQHNLATLKDRGIHIVQPENGELASGLWGAGRLPETSVLCAAVRKAITPASLAGLRVVVSAGPTHEAIDDVRMIANHSSGMMGYALAAMAVQRGASVTLVSGPTALPTPYGVERVDVLSAAEMEAAMQQATTDADIVVMAAAVADFRVARPLSGKMKKSEGTVPSMLELEQTPDILAGLGRKKPTGQTLVGFALETVGVEHYAAEKLSRKNLDMIVANSPGPESGFGGTMNTITILDGTAQPTHYPTMTKQACAEAIFDAIEAQRARRGDNQ
jgi:phosphopantothenoylcysteine decarboxylase / phosphopantothenate---cysteine ligase